MFTMRYSPRPSYSDCCLLVSALVCYSRRTNLKLAKVRIMESVSSDEEPPEHLCCLSREGRNPLGELVGN